MQRDAERILAAETVRLRPSGWVAPDPVVSHFMWWDDVAQRWDLLRSARQLHDGLQVYAAQVGIEEAEGPLPDPAVVIPGGVMLIQVWDLYHRIDVQHSARVCPEELGAALASCGVHFPPQTQAELFGALDSDGDGTLSFGEFAQMGLLYPSIVNYMYFMATEFQRYWKQRASFLRREWANKEQLRSLHDHEAALRREQAVLERERRLCDSQFSERADPPYSAAAG
eukprot:TRINITY_DN16542_c0_g1_i2.p2 TRINITY_DN16542_c0_g1~~TRINITY_DN16542_c0_g1_i2.p2  ORF type:complete len:226 (+),score=75.06 TRINITY_DN16542_c0_g1_i2:614-1291(+)